MEEEELGKPRMRWKYTGRNIEFMRQITKLKEKEQEEV
jgi:hypothetical protein